MGGQEQRIKELDGWRAISVSLVLFMHFFIYHLPRQRPRFDLLNHTIRCMGPLGVNIFFVISGLVICRLLILEDIRYGKISLKGFYFRRIFRILPPFYLYMAVISLLLAAGLIHQDWRQIVVNSLFLADIRFLPRDWFVGHTWSLAVEEQFYLIFPSLWVLTPQRHKSRVFITVFLFCVLWSLSLMFGGRTSIVEAETRAGFSCISCGVLIAIHEQRVRRLAARIPAVVVALVACMLLLHPTPAKTWTDAVYTSLVIPLAIGLLLTFSLERGPQLRALLCARPVQAMGLTSYGIYLWQQVFNGPKNFYAGWGIVLWYLLPLLLVIVPLSYYFVEKPAMRYGKMLSKRARESTTMSSSAVA